MAKQNRRRPEISSTFVQKRMTEALQARRPAVSLIDQPIHFSTGQFAGQTVRTQLIEVQKADLGRK